MKYLKKFEGIIEPKIEIEKGDWMIKLTKEDIKKLCEEYDCGFYEYDDFYNALDEEERKGCPSRMTPYFAFFSDTYKKPFFVVGVSYDRMPISKMQFLEILNHELIHQEQDRRSSEKYILPDVNKGYFVDKNEIMAFAYNIAKEIYNTTEPVGDQFKMIEDWMLKGARTASHQVRHLLDNIKRDIKKNSKNPDKDLKRYVKYIYQYLEHMHKKEEKIEESMKYLKTFESYGSEEMSEIISFPNKISGRQHFRVVDIDNDVIFLVNINNDEETMQVSDSGIISHYKNGHEMKQTYKMDDISLEQLKNVKENKKTFESMTSSEMDESMAIEHYVDTMITDNMSLLFDKIGLDMPEELEGPEFEQLMDEARNLAYEYFKAHPEEMK